MRCALSHVRAYVSVCAISVPLLSGCDVGINFWQNEVVHVDVPAAAQRTFSDTQDVTLGSASQSLPVGNLAAVRIPEIQLQVADIGSDNASTTLSGTLSITDMTEASFQPVTLPFADVPVTSGGELSIAPSADDVARLQPALLGNHPLQITYDASVDALPADFQLTAAIHVVAEVAL